MHISLSKAVSDKTSLRIHLAYIGTLSMFLLASFYPAGRVWGINWWAYYPVYVKIGLFLAGLAVLPIASRLATRWQSTETDISSKSYFVFLVAFILISGLLFYLLRSKTHFLGDGYQLLSTMASDNPFIRPRNYGGSLVPHWVAMLLGDKSEAGVLTSYRIVAIMAGVGFLCAVAVVARSLFMRNIDRLLFLLGISSGGYMLLFFGYVENYALFVLSVTIFGLVGLLSTSGKVSRWWTVPLQALAIFFHVFGVVLVPAAIYLLVANSRLGACLDLLPVKLKWGLAAVGVIGAAITFGYYYTTDYFFRFSVVPLLEDRFTAEGYILLSLKHLADYVNLLILLLPGLILVLSGITSVSIRSLFMRTEYRFLLVMSVCCCGIAFIFDPHLGMPRDWDLFSFAGVPIAISAIYMVLGHKRATGTRIRIILLMVMLGWTLLLPRSIAQIAPEVSFEYVRDYYALDHAKTGRLRYTLIERLLVIGDSAAAADEARWSKQERPEQHLLDSARARGRAGHWRETISWYERYLQIYPWNAKAWANAGVAYLGLGVVDSALECFRVSDGLNPYNAKCYYNLGLCNYNTGAFDKAEHYWLKSVRIDTTSIKPLLALSNLYRKHDLQEKYVHNFLRIAARADAPLKFLQGAVELGLQEEDYEGAIRNLSRALKKGLDTAYVQTLIKKYPELEYYLHPEE